MPALTPEQEALKSAALAATPGPWHAGSFDRNGVKSMVYAADEELRYVAQCSDFFNATPTPNESNAKFIAAANPAAILAMLAQLEVAAHAPLPSRSTGFRCPECCAKASEPHAAGCNAAQVGSGPECAICGDTGKAFGKVCECGRAPDACVPTDDGHGDINEKGGNS